MKIQSRAAALLCSGFLGVACATGSGDKDPDAAPVSPEETAAAEGGAPAPDTIGELSDNPAGEPPPPPGVTDDSLATPPDTAPVPESDSPEGAPGAFDDPQPEPADAPPPPPDVAGDIGSAAGIEPPPAGSDVPPAPAAGGGKEVRYVNAMLVNVRSAPNRRAPIVRRLLGGAKINVELQGKYAKIAAGQWVAVSLLSAEPTRKVSRAEVEKAWAASKYKDTWKPGAAGGKAAGKPKKKQKKSKPKGG